MRERVRARVKKKSGDKTVTAEVTIDRKHEMYGKFVRKTKSYQVHDEYNLFRPDDALWIVRCKPRSKHKTWEAVSESTAS